MPAIMIQGTMSGVGKTTLVTALCRIFADMGYYVAPFKSQNMSRFTYRSGDVLISRAQAVQAEAARCEPSADMNPVLLIPDGDDHSSVYAIGHEIDTMNAQQFYEWVAVDGMKIARGSLLTLLQQYDIVVMEGGGSPAEINLPLDMANMSMAEAAGAPVIIIADIERGGCFAQMVGTLSLLNKKHRSVVQGFVINKFRGDATILQRGIDHIKDSYDIKTLAVLPYMRTGLPSEDSLDEPAVANSQWEEAICNTARMVRTNLDMDRIQNMIL